MSVWLCLFRRDVQLLTSTEHAQEQKKGEMYRRGKDSRRIQRDTKAYTKGIYVKFSNREAEWEVTVREGEKEAWRVGLWGCGGWEGESEREHQMKNEASSQTGLRRHHTFPTQQSLGDTQGILGNAVRHATAQWPPDWLLWLGRRAHGRGRMGCHGGPRLAAVFLEAACEIAAYVGLSSDWGR